MDSKAEANMQGGGARGGPRRWTGAGPRPARHIPWPELFKHHESVLTGHLKMMDMVRKHCVEGSGNHTTAQSCVDRTREMIRMFKQTTWNFVPPKDSIDQVPVGASSASMYPGYSPADHIYGEAAREFGNRASEMKKKGLELDLDPKGPQYEIGQSSKTKRKHEAEEDPTKASREGAEESQSGDAQDEDTPMNGAESTDDGSQYFVIDTKPTPRSELNSETKPPKKKSKRKVSFADEQVNGAATNGISGSREQSVVDRSRKPQKVLPAKVAEEPSQVQDITAEVEAKLKAKEEKKKRREQKKRSREDSDLVGESQADTSNLSEKPKKKKAKHAKQAPESEEKAEAQAGSEGETKQKSSKKDRKQSSKKREAVDEVVVVPSAANGEESGEKGEKESRKKRKRV